MPRKAKKHDQIGMSMGLCPKCGRDMWANEATVITPERDDQGKLHAVLAHAYCPKEVKS